MTSADLTLLAIIFFATSVISVITGATSHALEMAVAIGRTQTIRYLQPGDITFGDPFDERSLD